MSSIAKIAATASIVFTALAVVGYKYWDYVTNPWTRDGKVRAEVIQIAPRLSGLLVRAPIKDNQLVKQGDFLFEIDPRPFKEAVDQARANLDKTRDDINALQSQVTAAKASVDQYQSQTEQAKIEVEGYETNAEQLRADFERAQQLVASGTISKQVYDARYAAYQISTDKLNRAKFRLIEATAALAQANAQLARAVAALGAPGEDNAQLRAAQAVLKTAELNLEFTQVKAPVDGYVTNLQLKVGDSVVAHQPVVALININSFYVHAFFRETFVGNIQAGDRAVVTLMSYPDHPLEGRVDSVGWGIALQDGSTGFQLLPNVSPTFEWIRLAQRVPVRIHLQNVPSDVKLRVGTTASVLVMTGTNEKHGGKQVPPVPRMLQ